MVAVNWEGAPPDLVDPLENGSALNVYRASSPRLCQASSEHLRAFSPARSASRPCDFAETSIADRIPEPVALFTIGSWVKEPVNINNAR